MQRGKCWLLCVVLGVLTAVVYPDFPTTQQIYLEQNYRSTGSILAASMSIISQGQHLPSPIVRARAHFDTDLGRIPKKLHTSHPHGPTPVIRMIPNEHAEAHLIAAEIKRLIAFSGGMLNWNDFAILLRFNSMSRLIEAALQKEGIPNRVLAGHRFFERMEVCCHGKR